jgi:hypothetical protein
MGKVRPASVLPSISHHFPFIHHHFLPHNAEFVATHCQLTSPTPCYRPPFYFPIHQTDFPSAVDKIPYLPGYQPLLPCFPLHFSPIASCDHKCYGFFCYLLCIPCHVARARVRSDQHRFSAQRAHYQPVFLLVHKLPVPSDKRSAGSQRITRWERTDLLARLSKDHT